MPKILVKTAFNLLLSPSGGRIHFTEGLHDVTDDVAGHWYTQLHAETVDGDALAPAGVATTDPGTLDSMGDGELREFVKARDGAELDESLGRAELLAAARAEPETVREPAPEPVAEVVEPAVVAEPDTEAQPEEEAAVVTAPTPDRFDAMSDEDLRAFVKDRDGRKPHPATSRDKLLLAARGDAAASAEAEVEEGSPIAEVAAEVPTEALAVDPAPAADTTVTEAAPAPAADEAAPAEG